MSDFSPESSSLVARLLRDPVRLRRRSWLLACLVGVLGALAGSGWSGVESVSSVLMALAWLLVPLVAAGIGLGDAFFLQHGLGQRRILLTLVGASLVAVASCVVLAVVTGAETSEEMLLSAALYWLLIMAVVIWLAAFVGLGVGRGGGYLSRKIQNVDDTGW